MLKARRSVDESISPFRQRPLTSVEDEIAFALPHRTELIGLISSFNAEMLETVRIDRTDKGYVRPAGDFILRIAYHEAVHTGQLLSYLRAIDVSRPNIWD